MRQKSPKKVHIARVIPCIAWCSFNDHIVRAMLHVIVFEVVSFFAHFSLKFSLSPQFSHLAIFPSFFGHSSIFWLNFHLFYSDSSTKYMQWQTIINDLLIFGSNLHVVNDVKSLLCNNFDMKDLGEGIVILGISITGSE